MMRDMVTWGMRQFQSFFEHFMIEKKGGKCLLFYSDLIFLQIMSSGWNPILSYGLLIADATLMKWAITRFR